jgi:heavy metal response regulator
MRLLLVEDEEGVSRFIQQGLTDAGFAVDAAPDGMQGSQFARSLDYDAIVLDIMLPGMDGLAVLRELRQAGVKTPVLVLTARHMIGDRVNGLNSGADDYLIKPFEFAELLARIRALLRRPPLIADPLLRLSDLEMDTVRHQVRRSGHLIDLTPREYSLLEYLLMHAGQVLTRTQLIEHVWDVHYSGDTNIVDVYIGYLRRKVDRPSSPSLIHTVRGFGYRLGMETYDS